MSRYDRRCDRRFDRHFDPAARKRGGIFAGILFCVAGGLLILRETGFPIPEWIFTWQMLLIAVGIYTGVKHQFRNIGFIFPILVGTVFLLNDFFPGFFPQHYLLPLALISVGLLIIFKPRGPRCDRPWQDPGWQRGNASQGGTAASDQGFSQGPASSTTTSENTFTDTADIIRETAVFGGIRKAMISKNFLGGEVSAVFGSAEINLMQAEILQSARLELNAVFGSVRLIVPAHWQVKMETNAVLGGVEDKRSKHAIYADKVLVLEGNAVFGGIQIESY